MSHIFISYSRQNQAYARQLAEDVRKHGFDVWIDDRIDYGEQWFEAIENAITQAGAFVIVMSPDSRKSPWVQKEILIAFRDQIPIFPLLLEGREFGNLIDLQFADVRGGRLPKADFYMRLERVIQPASTTGILVAPTDTLPAPPPKSRLSLIWLVVALLLLFGLGIAGAYLGGVFGDDSGEQPTEIAENPTATKSPTDSPSVTDTKTENPTKIVTITEAPGTPNIAASADELDRRETWIAETALAQTIAAYTSTATPNYDASTEALREQRVTQTAQAWTDTPTLTSTPTDTPRPSATPSPSETPTPTQLPLGFEPVTHNADWTLVEQEFDGVKMVLVPAGCFMMGSEENGQPAPEQCFEAPFWIDKYEVANAQYGSVSSEGCDAFSSEPDQPRNCVTWFEARDYCEGHSGRLPTEAEWEYAARGPDGLIYPWGNDFVGANVVYVDNSGNKAADVGSRPGGVSWVGALDMSGNLWEWTSSQYKDYQDSDNGNINVVRGGMFSYPPGSLRATVRAGGNADFGDYSIGFRCARSY
jgi:formylglycine-generating enzyme required for sulfatase activity